MSSENWKLEKDLCRCCHSEGSFKNLAEPFKITVLTDITEIYADILKECYDIDMAPVPGMLSAVTYTICEVCIMRLRDASEFKKQVLSCEERFKDMYDRNVIKAVTTVEIEVKQEILESEPDDDFRDDFKEDFSLDDNDEEDNDESMDTNINEEDEKPAIKVEVRKKRKYKARTKVKSEPVKTKKKTKRKNLKQEPADTETENDAETKQGPPTYYTIVQNEYQCNICGKAYSSQPLVSQHYRFVHLKRRPKDRKCTKCDERIPDYLRTAHLEKEHGVPAPSCGVCGKKFRFPCNVIQHQKKVHMGERSETCEVCDKSFFNKLSLKLHMSTHSAEKRFKCEVCEREFRWENNLRDHVRIHTGDKRFVCSVCEKAFVQKSTLKQHAARNHPGVDVS